MKKIKSSANEDVKKLNKNIKADSNEISQKEQIEVFVEILIDILIKELNEKNIKE